MTSPSCFGLPSIYHQESPRCRDCSHREGCESTAYAKLVALSRSVDVTDALARFQHRAGPVRPVEAHETVSLSAVPPERSARRERLKVSLNDIDQALIDALPVKVATKVRRMMQRNMDQMARHLLAQGKNPFPLKGAGFLHVACELLLSGGFTRSRLRQTYVERFGWTNGTAAAHVSNVTAMFPALRIAIEGSDGAFVMHPSVREHH